MSLDQDFWRLLGDYERLTRDETTAIRERDFSALEEANKTKLLIFAELLKIGGMLGLDRGHATLGGRLTLLGEAEQHNVALVRDGIAKSRLEFKMLHAASMRLRAIEHVYATESHGANSEGSLRAQV